MVALITFTVAGLLTLLPSVMATDTGEDSTVYCSHLIKLLPIKPQWSNFFLKIGLPPIFSLLSPWILTVLQLFLSKIERHLLLSMCFITSRDAGFID